jgi:hypothetical protein
MKTQIITLLVALFTTIGTFAQGETQTIKIEKHRDPVIYTLFINSVPDNFYLPLIGFMNDARGNHYSAQIGFVNTTRRNFGGGQIGFINTVGGNVDGTQIGFINTTAGSFGGVQIGFINTVAKKTNAIQVAFINTAADTLTGAQIGFINTSTKKTNAAQIGFVNTAKTLKGAQVGFINLADSIECGVPLGFISIVRKGGYHALELSLTEMHPINLSYKIGVSQLYTTFNFSYDPANAKNIAIGAGLGSILPLSKNFFFNPEYVSQTFFLNDFQQMNSFAAMVGYQFGQHLSLMAGPSVVLQYESRNKPLTDPFFSFTKTPVYNNANLITGARLALRYNF